MWTRKDTIVAEGRACHVGLPKILLPPWQNINFARCQYLNIFQWMEKRKKVFNNDLVIAQEARGLFWTGTYLLRWTKKSLLQCVVLWVMYDAPCIMYCVHICIVSYCIGCICVHCIILYWMHCALHRWSAVGKPGCLLVVSPDPDRCHMKVLSFPVSFQMRVAGIVESPCSDALKLTPKP